MMEKVKQFIADMNEKGIPVPMVRDPQKDGPSISLTMLIISFTVVLVGLIGKASGFFGGINLDQAIYFFMVCSGLYFARSVGKKSKDGTEVTVSEGKNDE